MASSAGASSLPQRQRQADHVMFELRAVLWVPALIASRRGPRKDLRENIRTVATWNWIEGRRHNGEIVVPGHPPKLLPQNLPLEIKPDSAYLIEKTGIVVQQQFAFEALATALRICSPQLDVKTIDIVIDRSTLHDLQNYVLAYSDEIGLELELELHGNTLFVANPRNITADELYRTERLYSDEKLKYLEQAATIYCCELRRRKVDSFYRAVMYDLQGLRIIVQQQNDAFDCSCHLEGDQNHDVCPMNDQRFTYIGVPESENHGRLAVWRHGDHFNLFNSDCIAEIKVGAMPQTQPSLLRDHCDMSKMYFAGTEKLCNIPYDGNLLAEPLESTTDMENSIGQWELEPAINKSLMDVAHLLSSARDHVKFESTKSSYCWNLNSTLLYALPNQSRAFTLCPMDDKWQPRLLHPEFRFLG